MHECDQTGGGLWCRIEEEVSARVAEERVAETKVRSREFECVMQMPSWECA